ncbi:MAG: hypothetical protein JSS27_17625 [Planctomycetes bacterium]|nr:hypothetical protein [Planctomycetota bacterium]
MARPGTDISRRDWLAGAAAGAMLGPSLAFAQSTGKRRPRVAALFTELRLRSHAYNILESFFKPYLFCGELVDPGCDVVSFYADQFPDGDMARDVSARFNVPLYTTIDQALCCGGRELAVDAVLLIGEHGDYPLNEHGVRMYPRKQFFDQAVAVMRRSNRFVPLFNDKHLSYRWDWAREMFDTARANQMPLLLGSSVPLAQRLPALELPRDAEIETAIAVHGGPLEAYGFHGLELLQSFVEARRGGETGIRSVEVVERKGLFRPDMLRGDEESPWWLAMFRAAMRAHRDADQQTGRKGGDGQPGCEDQRIDHAMLINYADGLRGAVIKVGSSSSRWDFACQLRGEQEPRATAMYNGPWGNRCLFRALSHAIQHLFVTGQEPYPAERTLLTTGALAAAVQSHAQGKPIETPELNITYRATDWRAFRENGESWKKITTDTPEPATFEPGDAALIKGR